MTYTKTSPFLRFSPFWAFFRQKGDNCSPQAIKRGREGKETPSAHPERLQRKAVGGRRAALLAGAPASQRMQAEQFGRICGRALPFALCVGRARGLRVLAWRFSALVAGSRRLAPAS